MRVGHATWRVRAVVLAVIALTMLPTPLPSFAAAGVGGVGDITAAVRADANVTLTGDAVVNLPAGATLTYTGVISGTGTLTVNAPAGSGTLILTRDSDFTLPPSSRRQSVTRHGDPWPYWAVSNPDRPAVIVNTGATLQYGTGGGTGLIGHFPYPTQGYQLNQDNIEVNGTLRLSLTREFSIGTITGSGLVVQPRNMWGTLDVSDALPFSGVISNGTGMAFGKQTYPLSMPDVKALINGGSSIFDTPLNYTLLVRQDFYESNYGNDVDLHSRRGSKVVLAGVYSYSDQNTDTDPSLSDPSLNLRRIAHDLNFRAVNIEGANVQWGDGTTHRFFLPAIPANSYINIHHNGTLTFDYNGPVTLGTGISGGIYHDSLSTPAYATVALSPTPGNAVTFATPQNYHGLTSIGQGAALQLGSGVAGGDSSLLSGAAVDRITDDGDLTVRNTSAAIALGNISGSGSLTQSGTATTTLTGTTAYAGPTVVSAGTLALAAGTLQHSAGVDLTGSGATLDLRRAGNQTLQRLAGVARSTVQLAGNTLTVDARSPAVFAGSVQGGNLAKTGAGTLTLTGANAGTGAAWQVGAGTLQVGDVASAASAEVSAPVSVASGATLQGTGSVNGSVDNGGTVATSPAGGALTIGGDYRQHAGASFAVAVGTTAYRPLKVTGQVALGGALVLTAPPGAALTTGHQITLIDDTGKRPVTGTFTGLPEGASVTAAGSQYRISYTGGDGNDVVLKVTRAAAAAADGSNAADGGPIRTAAGSTSGSTLPVLLWLATAVALATAALAFVAARRRRPGGRRRARARGADRP
ncbi:autotransporter-associated beta strand protein [Streptacidiphilus sp. MAP12-16]|uniref:autotransporter-associated beta strand repeat-containing protein n=1 Tax=Streptacidiphilus sp. MAP12-16 TaxID=3156300 RepID=UPI003513E1BD